MKPCDFEQIATLSERDHRCQKCKAAQAELAHAHYKIVFLTNLISLVAPAIKISSFSAKNDPQPSSSFGISMGYALKEKKSSYKQVKTDHLCFYDILGFQNNGVHFHTLWDLTHCVCPRWTDRTLALFEWNGFNLHFPNTQRSCLNHCHFWKVNTPDLLV